MLFLKFGLALFSLSIALTKETPNTFFGENEYGVGSIDLADIEYFSSFNETLNNALSRRGLGFVSSYTELTMRLLGFFVNSFSINKLTDLSNFLSSSPPKLHNRKPGLPAASIREVEDFLPWAMIASCPIVNGNMSICVCEKTFSEVNYIIEESADAVVALAVHPKKKLIIVTYSPTRTLNNFVTDFDYVWVDMPMSPNGTKVHKGFLNHFQATKLQSRMIMGRLLENYPSYNLHITGFSLGSAVATISLPYWSQFLKSKNDSRKIRAFLYSGPRVGNEAFVRAVIDLKIQITRYTNRNDIVSHLPPRNYGFVHVGSEVHELYPRSTKSAHLIYKKCDRMFDEDPNCGWKDKFPVSILVHTRPMNRSGPLPSYC